MPALNDLALLGGKPAIPRPLRRFNTINGRERAAVAKLLKHDLLSGFLGGKLRGGYWVCRLEELWTERFGCKYAIACNSATSGLLAACVVTDKSKANRIATTPFTMSATSAAPLFAGYPLHYVDIDPETFCMRADDLPYDCNVLTTNLFGQPGYLRSLKRWCDKNNTFLIEDNAQSPFASEHGQYTGTIGHIGVFSLNVHKHIQAGEGGIVVTDDPRLASALRGFINHGEMARLGYPGLNLRMTEVTAAIAIEQLAKADEIIADRVLQAERLSTIASKFSWLEPPKVRKDCSHVYYIWAVKVNSLKEFGVPRNRVLTALAAEGFPLSAGYVDPLYRLPAFAKYANPCPVAEAMHDEVLACFENCAYTVGTDDFDYFEYALKKIERNISVLRGRINLEEVNFADAG
jgi:perosamine synthetase